MLVDISPISRENQPITVDIQPLEGTNTLFLYEKTVNNVTFEGLSSYILENIQKITFEQEEVFTITTSGVFSIIWTNGREVNTYHSGHNYYLFPRKGSGTKSDFLGKLMDFSSTRPYVFSFFLHPLFDMFAIIEANLPEREKKLTGRSLRGEFQPIDFEKVGNLLVQKNSTKVYQVGDLIVIHEKSFEGEHGIVREFIEDKGIVKVTPEGYPSEIILSLPINSISLLKR